jgi:hypothetical protein
MPTPPGKADTATPPGDVFDPPTQSPDPLAKLLVGAWSTIYSNQLHRAITDNPNILPGKTLGIFLFDAESGVKGELRPNVLGKVERVIPFGGTYSLGQDAFGLLEGTIIFRLPSLSGGSPSTNRIFFVMRGRDVLDWVLVESDDPARVVVAGGTLFRIQPVHVGAKGGQKGSDKKFPKKRDAKP